MNISSYMRYIIGEPVKTTSTWNPSTQMIDFAMEELPLINDTLGLTVLDNGFVPPLHKFYLEDGSSFFGPQTYPELVGQKGHLWYINPEGHGEEVYLESSTSVGTWTASVGVHDIHLIQNPVIGSWTHVHVPAGRMVQFMQAPRTDEEAWPGMVQTIQGPTIWERTGDIQWSTMRVVATSKQSTMADFTELLLPQDVGFEAMEGMEDKLEVSLVDTQTNYRYPARIKIQGDLMLSLTSWGGKFTLWAHQREGVSTWKKQDTPVIYTDATRLTTGLIYSDNFTNNGGDIFITYEDLGENNAITFKVEKFTLAKNAEGNWAVTAQTVIWNLENSGYAFPNYHLIMDGFFSNGRLYFLVGDLMDPQWVQDDTKPHGKLFSCLSDGTDVKLEMKGLRNEYVLRLPLADDNLERVWAVGNGNNIARTWLATLGDQVVNMGWSDAPEDTNSGWLSQSMDVNNPRSPTPNAILQTFNHDPSPNGHDIFKSTCPIHQRDTLVPANAPGSVVQGAMCFFGRGQGGLPETETYLEDYDRRVCLVTLGNLTGAQPDIEITPILKNKQDGTVRCPLPLVIDQSTGDLFFGEIREHKMYRVRFL